MFPVPVTFSKWLRQLTTRLKPTQFTLESRKLQQAALYNLGLLTINEKVAFFPPCFWDDKEKTWQEKKFASSLQPSDHLHHIH